MARTRLFHWQNNLINKHMASTIKELIKIVTHGFFVENIAEFAGGKYGHADYCGITAVAH